MRILHLVHSYGLGGAETFSIDAILALKEQGVKQFVFCRKHAHLFERLHQGGIPYELMNFVGWKKWSNHRFIRRKIKTYAPDVVHCWQPRAAIFMPAGSDVPALGWFGNYSKLKHYTTCDYYMGVSHDIVEYIGRESGHPDRVFLGHTFGTLAQDPPISSEEFGISENKTVVLMLARMDRVKGVDTLLRACVNLDVFLLLAGDGPELENYKSLARDLGMESRVCFAGWRRNRSALLDIADVLAVPSRKEPFGTVMPEAWSKGVPVVATRADGPRQYIQHGVNGLLSEIDDIDGLTKNLQAVLEDDALRKRIISEGKCTYQSCFSKETVIGNLLKTYEEIMRRGVVS